MKAKLAAIRESASRDGWSIKRTSGGRLRFTHPEVDFPIFTSASPGEFRSLRNLEASLQRALRRNITDDEPFTEPVADVSRVRKKKKSRATTSLDFARRVPLAPDTPQPNAAKGWSALESLQNRYAKVGAWKYAVLRMRVIAGRKWSDIIPLRQKFKTDPSYQRELVAAWANATKHAANDEVIYLRERLLMKGKITRAIEMFRRISTSPDTNGETESPRDSYRNQVRFGRPIRKPA